MKREIRIERVDFRDIQLLVALSARTFIQSHGHSAEKKEIDSYVQQAYHPEQLMKELSDSNTQFYFLYFNTNLAGYSKICFHTDYSKIVEQPISKLDRLYIDSAYLEYGLGQPLLEFNFKLAKEQKQLGVWLYTWVENPRAIRFYERNGFKIIDEKDFKISQHHSNPNFIMYKSF